MKYINKIIIYLLVILSLVPFNVHATNAEVNGNIINFSDGSYITIETASLDMRATSTKTGKRIYTYRNSDGDEQWKAVLTGTYTYTGSTSSCISSTCDVTITNTNWYIIFKTTGKSGNTATANLTMGRKLLGIKVDEELLNMKLTCDANGNLS